MSYTFGARGLPSASDRNTLAVRRRRPARTDRRDLTEPLYAQLDDRGVIALAGDDTLSFLQALVTNDVDPAGSGRAVYAALLTPQGKYLHDFILAPADGRLLVDCERARLDDLKRRLTLYRLRAKVTIEDASGALAVFALFGDGAPARIGLGGSPGDTLAFGGGVACLDPRHAGLGGRAILPRDSGAATLDRAGLKASTAAAYDRHRLALGVAQGAEIGPDRTLALEAGLDGLNGVSFSKGCYVGQEVTTRMHNRKLVRKRILPVAIDGPTPAPGTPVMLGEIEAGELRTVDGGLGLALLRLESVESARQGATLTVGGARVIPRLPDWLKLGPD